jgi:undecaprenyl-diphosphatase
MEVTYFSSLLLGIVEGITEFIPVSSTAHIIIAAQSLGITTSSFFTAFSIAIQTGAIIAALLFFWKQLWGDRSLIPKIIVAFIPTALVGLLLHPFISRIFSETAVIAWALIIGGVVLIILKPIEDETSLATLSYKKAFLIGCAQILAFIPGVSRSGATLIGGTTLGISRALIVPFSFLLGIPTIVGAGIVEVASLPTITTTEWGLILLGACTACITALLTMRFFITLLTKKPLSWFGWYRILLGLLVLFFIA